MNSGVYAIWNTESKKVYIGASQNLRRREYCHFAELKRGKHPNSYLQNAYSKYGRLALHFEVLEYCESSELVTQETWWIDFFNSRDRQYGYNLLSADRKTHSDESKAKMSLNASSRRPEVKAKISAAKKGKPLTDECKKNMSVARMGRSRPSFTDEWKEKLSLSHKDQGAKDYVLCSPSGEIIAVRNLRRFCKENGLSSGCMSDVVTGKRAAHKGWTVKR